MNKLKFLLMLSFSVFIIFGTAQEKKRIILEIGYPLPVGNNFIKNYFSFIDLGAKYIFLNHEKFHYGVSTNLGMSRYQNLPYITRCFMLKPRFDIEYSNSYRESLLSPFIGIGYSFFYFHAIPKDPKLTDATNDGININLGVKMNFSEKIYGFLSYDFIKFRTEKRVKSSYNSNINFINFGIGIQIKTMTSFHH
jgi:hypothetical protein